MKEQSIKNTMFTTFQPPELHWTALVSESYRVAVFSCIIWVRFPAFSIHCRLVSVKLTCRVWLRSQQQVQEDQLASLVDWLTAQPRAAQLLDKDSSIVNTLEYHMNRCLKDVKRHLVRADKRWIDPAVFQCWVEMNIQSLTVDFVWQGPWICFLWSTQADHECV